MNAEPAESSPRTVWTVHAVCYGILACFLVSAFAGRLLLPLTVGESAGIESPLSGEDEPGETTGDMAAVVRQRIDPNTATIDEWTRLPGIGAGTARKIISFREGQRPFVATRLGDETLVVFRSLSDLKAISGLNAATIERIAPYLRFPADSLP